MKRKISQSVVLLRNELGLYLSISFGVFLFILFFQPFSLDRFEFNNKLIFVAGLGAIVFLLIVLIRITFLWFILRSYQNLSEIDAPFYFRDFLIWLLSSVAFAFYLRYVGLVSISFYIMFKVVLICLAPLIVLRLFNKFSELRIQNESLLKEIRIVTEHPEKYGKDFLNKSIEFISENSAEKLNLVIADVILMRSADNYVEIVYKEVADIKKRLIRNTLKNVEKQVNLYSNFIRCHRTCIINTHYINKLNRRFNNYWLTLKDINDNIPVSRQYLLKIKENI